LFFTRLAKAAGGRGAGEEKRARDNPKTLSHKTATNRRDSEIGDCEKAPATAV